MAQCTTDRPTDGTHRSIVRRLLFVLNGQGANLSPSLPLEAHQPSPVLTAHGRLKGIGYE